MTPPPPSVSVLVPVLNEERHLRDVVARMRAQDYEGELELIFVDGGSEDGSRRLLEELAAGDPHMKVLDNPGRRTPNALNIGLREARGEYIVRMDAHTLYPTDYVSCGVERILRGDVTHVSGPAIAKGVDRGSRRVALALSTRLGVGEATFRMATDEEIEVDTGFAGVWRRDTLRDAGGWDEGWPIDQDFELAARLSAAGGRHVVLPRMAADYIPRNSLAKLWRQYWWYGYYRVKTAQRHPRSVRPSHLVPAALVTTVGVALASPRPLRRLARAGLALYGGVLARTAARAAADAPAGDAAALPAIYATMHLAYGAGTLYGVARLGVPARGVLLAVRRVCAR